MTPPGAPSVSLRTLGCKVNQAESEEIASALIEIGHRLSTAGTADVVVVNSCCVTAEAERKVRKAVRRALADAPDATVVVTGCLATIDAAGVAGLGPRVVVERDKSRIAERVDEIVGRPGVRAASAGTSSTVWLAGPNPSMGGLPTGSLLRAATKPRSPPTSLSQRLRIASWTSASD